MRYEDYIANLASLAVTVANAGSAGGLTGVDAELFDEHHVVPPDDDELARLLPDLRRALVAVATAADPEAVNRLLDRYPPRLRVSAHDGLPHLHHADNGEAGLAWLGRCCAAGLAHIACGVPDVTIGRCQAAGCERFFVDRSRNRSRRFCSNTCASRTTVAAYRRRRSADSRSDSSGVSG